MPSSSNATRRSPVANVSVPSTLQSSPSSADPCENNPLEFIRRFKERSSLFIRNAYEYVTSVGWFWLSLQFLPFSFVSHLTIQFLSFRVEHTAYLLTNNHHQTGVLSTSLPEDVFSLLHNEVKVLSNFLLQKTSDDDIHHRHHETLFADGIQHMLQELRQQQTSNRFMFLTTLQDSCAAANDFLRMSESLERFLEHLENTVLFWKQESKSMIGPGQWMQLGSDLVALYSQDAVMAAERTQLFIMRSIQKTSIAADYFSSAWETEWTENDVTLSMLHIFEETLTKARRYIASDYLFSKALVISCKAMICFYVRCLINKADSVTKRRRNRERIGMPGEKEPFQNHSKAIRRMTDDISIMKRFFRRQCQTDGPIVQRIIDDDLGVLEVILECVGAKDVESLESFIVVIHKRTGADPLVTAYFVADLWMLTTNDHTRTSIRRTLELLQPDLQMVTTRMNEGNSKKKQDEFAFVRLDQMLKTMYEDRIAQGILPACWACLPKVENGGDPVVTKHIRSLTRKVAELKILKKGSF